MKKTDKQILAEAFYNVDLPYNYNSPYELVIDADDKNTVEFLFNYEGKLLSVETKNEDN